MKALFFYMLKCGLVILLITGTATAFAQENDSATQQVNTWISARQFVFKAQTATPLTGGLIQLNYPYDLRIVKDSIMSYLPYYGRAYVAPISTDDAGLSFTTTGFSYESEKQENGKWEIAITTKDLRDNHKLFFTIYEKGQAELQVTSNNRQPIRFNGYIIQKQAK